MAKNCKKNECYRYKSKILYRYHIIHGEQFNLYIKWSVSVKTDIWITDIFYVHRICDMDLSCVLHVSSRCIFRRIVLWTFTLVDNEKNYFFWNFFFWPFKPTIQHIEILKDRFIGVTIDHLSIQSVDDYTLLPSLLLLWSLPLETPRAHISVESPYNHCVCCIPFAAAVSTQNFSF